MLALPLFCSSFAVSQAACASSFATRYNAQTALNNAVKDSESSKYSNWDGYAALKAQLTAALQNPNVTASELNVLENLYGYCCFRVLLVKLVSYVLDIYEILNRRWVRSRTIEKQAFMNCKKLKKVTLSNGKALKTIGSKAFKGTKKGLTLIFTVFWIVTLFASLRIFTATAAFGFFLSSSPE